MRIKNPLESKALVGHIEKILYFLRDLSIQDRSSKIPLKFWDKKISGYESSNLGSSITKTRLRVRERKPSIQRNKGRPKAFKRTWNFLCSPIPSTEESKSKKEMATQG